MTCFLICRRTRYAWVFPPSFYSSWRNLVQRNCSQTCLWSIHYFTSFSWRNLIQSCSQTSLINLLFFLFQLTEFHLKELFRDVSLINSLFFLFNLMESHSKEFFRDAHLMYWKRLPKPLFTDMPLHYSFVNLFIPADGISSKGVVHRHACDLSHPWGRSSP